MRKADGLPMKIDKLAKDESQVRTNSKIAMKAQTPYGQTKSLQS